MSDQNTLPLWIFMATVSKRSEGSYITSAILGWRINASENEAKGSFLSVVETEKPGFSIDEITCIQVPEAALRFALGMEADAAAAQHAQSME